MDTHWQDDFPEVGHHLQFCSDQLLGFSDEIRGARCLLSGQLVGLLSKSHHGTMYDTFQAVKYLSPVTDK